MRKITLGRTGLEVTAVSLGCLPIQRVPMEEACRILRKAYDSGINYYDTANKYTDSEEKIGNALSDVRHNIIISTKTGAKDKATAQEHIENSLRMLKTDYIDLLQFHKQWKTPISETACENGNRMLDRVLVVPVAGRETSAYFRELVNELCQVEI